jgi:hypothetical protein
LRNTKEGNMRSTLIMVGAATVLNVGLWLWAHPGTISRPSTIVAQTGPSDKLARDLVSGTTSQAQCPVPSSVSASAQDGKTSAAGSEKVPDQPWLNTVRDNVMALSLSPKVAERLVVKDVECAGAKCAITGALKPSSEGSSDVAALMQTLNDGEIAGGDSGRQVLLNGIQLGSAGTEFTMTVEGHEGPPARNPCQSVLDAWKTSHPEDFSDNNPFKAKG